jgi:hypothetical protein
MDVKLEKKIISVAPYMFIGYYKSPQESCLSFGIETSSGWYELIYNLVKELAEIDKNKVIVVDQVKEKFGVLSFYYTLTGDCDNEKIDRIVDTYEHKSKTTCEMCGEKGEIKYRGGWATCLCEKCRKKRMDGGK